MLEMKKKPTEHRQGTLINFVDVVQELINLQYDKELIVHKGDDDFDYNYRVVEKILDILKELRSFDITTVGNLYLTSGGRVVLDKGYGEYFNESDKVIYTLDELKSGVKYEKFMKRISEIKTTEATLPIYNSS